MKYREKITYPVSVESLLMHFSNPNFFAQKYTEQGAQNVRVQASTVSPTTSSITVTREIQLDVDVPAFGRGLIPSRITVIQTDAWDRQTMDGQLSIIFEGLPVHLTCKMQLREDAGKAHQTLDFDIRVNVPLIGKKLEEFIAKDLRRKFEKDTAVTMRILSSL